MRIIETYHHEHGTKKQSKTKLRLFYAVTILILVVVVFPVMSTQDANEPMPAAVLQDSTEQRYGASNETGDITPKDYDLSPIVLPSSGQTAFKVRGDRVWSSGTNYQAPMASITKVVTALAVLEKAPLDPGQGGDMIEFTLIDEDYYREYLAKQGTVTGVTAGQTISQYHALQAILLASSNNIADTLADHYFGGQEEFVSYANSMLYRLGLEDTSVADASGFNPASVSTPLDLVALGEYALDHPVVAEIVAQEEAYIMDNVRIQNYNALIGFDEITGIKPGFTDEAGYCLLFSADFTNEDGDTEEFIAVVSGIQNRDEYFTILRSVYENAKQTISNQ